MRAGLEDEGTEGEREGSGGDMVVHLSLPKGSVPLRARAAQNRNVMFRTKDASTCTDWVVTCTQLS